MFLIDIETDGFLRDLTRVHCMTVAEILPGKPPKFHDAVGRNQCGELTDMVMRGDTRIIVAHNGIKFDIPALAKVFPWFHVGKERMLDTLVLARLLYPDIYRQLDEKNEDLPPKYIGSHKLAAWGYRLGVLKDEYTGGFEEYNEEMGRYCHQDVVVTVALWEFLQAEVQKRGWNLFETECIQLEHKCEEIIARQERKGFYFLTEKAKELDLELQRERDSVGVDLQAAFPPFYKRPKVPKEFTPARDDAKKGYVKGCPFVKVEAVQFKPTSRDHIIDRLKVLHGWEPEEFTSSGAPKIDDTVISNLPFDFPQKPLLLRYLVLEKRIGQLSAGNQGWLKLVTPENRIHGSVNICGCNTGRATHANPNVSQVPAGKKFKAEEMRSLWAVPEGKVLIDSDLSAIEAVCLAHYMAKWDGGAYVKAVSEGNSDDGTDFHSLNCKALGMDPKATYKVGARDLKGRDIAKTFIYAFLYGAGPGKIAKILGVSPRKAKKIMRQFLDSTPALKSLKEAVEKAVTKRGYLIGLDGRHIPVRSPHSALNALLQAAGAIISKKWMVLADWYLRNEFFQFAPEQVAWIHDALNHESNPYIAPRALEIIVKAAEDAGKALGLKAPVRAAGKIGPNWYATH